MSATLGKTKQAFFFLVMMLLTGTICFVVLELVLATYYSERQSANWGEFHPLRGWGLIPGEYRVKPLERLGSFTLEINERGLRGHRLPDRTRGGKPLVVLGDSFTFAGETATERMFAQQLQVLLDDFAPGSFEVINGGVPGYGTSQQLLLMRELRDEHDIRGEVYLLVFFTNDILDNLCLSYGNLAEQPARPRFVLTQEGDLVLERLPEKRIDAASDDTLGPPTRGGSRLKTVRVSRALVEEWLQTRPGLVRFLGGLGVGVQLARIPGLLNGWYREEIVAEGMPITAALIGQMKREVEEMGGVLLVSMVPSPLQVYPDTYLPVLRRSFEGDPIVERFAEDILRPQRLMRKVCEEAGIPFQDLFPVFREGGGQALFIPRDGHLNDAGHRVVSEALFEFVSRQSVSGKAHCE